MNTLQDLCEGLLDDNFDFNLVEPGSLADEGYKLSGLKLDEYWGTIFDGVMTSVPEIKDMCSELDIKTHNIQELIRYLKPYSNMVDYSKTIKGYGMYMLIQVLSAILYMLTRVKPTQAELEKFIKSIVDHVFSMGRLSSLNVRVTRSIISIKATTEVKLYRPATQKISITFKKS